MAKRFTDTMQRIVSLEQHKKRMIGYRGWLHFDGWDVVSGKIWDFPAVYVIYLDRILSYQQRKEFRKENKKGASGAGQ